MPRSLAAISAVIVGLTLAACSADASPSQAPGGAQDSASEDASDGGETVEVSLSEFEIDMPTSISAGHVTFNVTNDGTMTHALEVEGNGIEEETEEIAAGDSATLEVDLEAGTYEIYCPVGDHRGMGMELDLEVTGS